MLAGGELDELDVMDVLDQLVDKSLVVADEQDEGGVRYRLLESIRRVANGEILVDPAVTKRVVARATTGADAAADLSLRDRQVLDQIAAGLTNRQIAEHLGLAEKTVKNYVSGLLAKLGMERRTQAAVYRAGQKLVE